MTKSLVISNPVSTNTASTVVLRDSSGNFSAGTITAALSGNASSATTLQTARTINGTSFNGSSNIAVLPAYDTNYRRISNPAGAEYVTTTATITGAIAVELPVGMLNTMVRVTIKIYEYTTNESFEVHAGGYTYNVGNTWTNSPFAYIVGNPSIDRRFTVRFGYTAAGKAVIYIGELTSTWSYPQVYVTDIQCGYSGQAVTYTTGWSISFQSTAFENVTATITNSQVGYATSSNTTNAVVLRDASGNFSAGTITASLSGNASTVTNGVYTTGSYSNPSWITSIDYTKLTGTVPTWNQNTTGTATNVTGTVAIANGGTGATTASAARLAILPSITGNGGKALVVNAGATDFEYAALGGTGTVTSVAVSVPSFLSVSGSPITAAGTISVAYSGTALPVANGGTGSTTATGSGSVVLATAPTLTGTRETKVTMAANNIAVNTGNYFSKTISGATTLTVSGVPTTGTGVSFILDLTNGGSAAITWFSGVKWAGGTAPTLTASGRDVLGFFTHDGGTTWTGLLLGKDVK